MRALPPFYLPYNNGYYVSDSRSVSILFFLLLLLISFIFILLFLLFYFFQFYFLLILLFLLFLIIFILPFEEARRKIGSHSIPTPTKSRCLSIEGIPAFKFFFFHLTGTGINCSKSQAFNWILCVISDSDTFTTYVACPWFEFAFVNCSNNSGLFFLLESDLICLDPTRFPAVPEAEAQNKPSPTASGYFLSSTLLFQRASTVLCHTLLVCT